MEISTITTERLSNDNLQFSSPKANHLINSASGFEKNNMEQQGQQQQQQQQEGQRIEQQNNQHRTELKSHQVESLLEQSINTNNPAKAARNHDETMSNGESHEPRDDQFTADIKLTIESLLSRVDAEFYPIVTATTSQSLYDSCTKVPLISPVKDEDLNKTSDIVTLRNLEITPPPNPTPPPNLKRNVDDATSTATARKRRTSQRTQSEQSDESSTATSGRSKRLRKQTELFQAQSDKKPATSSSSTRRSRIPELKPQNKQPQQQQQQKQQHYQQQQLHHPQAEEPKFQDVIFYERGDHLAIRNEENTFYLCQLTENVRVQRPIVKVRWLDTEDDGQTYFLTSHYDKVPRESIIMPVTLEKMKSDKKSRLQFKIDDQIRDTVLDRLRRSLNIPEE